MGEGGGSLLRAQEESEGGGLERENKKGKGRRGQSEVKGKCL